jgi:hypothetical protein
MLQNVAFSRKLKRVLSTLGGYKVRFVDDSAKEGKNPLTSTVQ